MRADDELVGSVTRFVAQVVAPRVTDLERSGEGVWALRDDYAALGLTALGVGEEHGGLQPNLATRVRVMEELAYGWSALAGSLASVWAASSLIEGLGTPAQQAAWLPRLAAGEVVASISLSEPQAGSDTSAISCTATPDGDAYLITGTKTWVTNGGLADLVIVAARAPEGNTAFVVDAAAAIAAGQLHVSGPLRTMGHRGQSTVEMTYDRLRVSVDDVLGGPAMLGRGQRGFLGRIEVNRLYIAAMALGIARSALDAALGYGADRVAFGRPIREHQAISFKLVDMATRVTSARLMLAHATEALDRAESSATALCSMAKLLCTEVGVEASLESMRIHGGIGYVEDLPIERLFRDAPLLAIGEGTNEIQRIIIARWLDQQKTFPAS